MKVSILLATSGLYLLFLSACGAPGMIENTVETSDGSKITVAVKEPNPAKGIHNPVANMQLLFSTGMITRRETAFIEAAELKSGCTVLKDTFAIYGRANGVASVELQ